MSTTSTKPLSPSVAIPDSDADDSELSDPENHYDTEPELLEAMGISRDGSLISGKAAEEGSSEDESDSEAWETQSYFEDALEQSLETETQEFPDGTFFSRIARVALIKNRCGSLHARGGQGAEGAAKEEW